MRVLHLDVGQATFCHNATKLQCQATTRAVITIETAYDEEVNLNLDTLISLGLCYRVPQPFNFLIDFAFDHVSNIQDEKFAHGFRDLVATQISSAQLWQQLGLDVVSADLPSPLDIRHPIRLQLRLGLEHRSPLREGLSPCVNVNDLNYPAALTKAQIAHVAVALSFAGPAQLSSATAGKARPDEDLLNHDTKTELCLATEPLLAIVDVALRCIISPGKQRLGLDVKRIGPLASHTLQSVFPAIFSPAAVQHIFDRNRFICGISRSLLSCLSRSSSTESGLREFACDSQVHQCNQLFQPDIDQNATLESIEAHFWNLLMHSAQNIQQRTALSSIREPQQAGSLASIPLSEQLTKSSSTSQFDQSQYDCGSHLNEILFDCFQSGVEPETETADWLCSEDVFGQSPEWITTREHEDATLPRNSLSAEQPGERERKIGLDDEDDEMLETCWFRDREAAVALLPFAQKGLDGNLNLNSRQHDSLPNSIIEGQTPSSLKTAKTTFLPTQHEHYDKIDLQPSDDSIGSARSLGKEGSRITSVSDQLFSNWVSALPLMQSVHTDQHVFGDESELDVMSLEESYLLYEAPDTDAELLPGPHPLGLLPELHSELLLTDDILPATSLSSSSDDDLFLTTPNSTQESMLSFQDLHRQAVSKTPGEEPTLEELLGDDKGLWDMWQRRGSLGVQSGNIHAMYESDPDVKVLRGRNKSSSSADSMEDNNIQRPSSAYVLVPTKRSSSTRSSDVKKHITPSFVASSPPPEKKPGQLSQSSNNTRVVSKQKIPGFDINNLQALEIEVKRRKTPDGQW